MIRAGAGRYNRRVLKQAWIPALLAALAFSPSLRAPFFPVDDPVVISTNPVLLDPTAAHVLQILDPFSPRGSVGPEYLPVRDLSFCLDVWIGRALAGRAALSTVCRSTQAAYFALGALAAALLARALTGRRDWALLAGLLFALHPCHPEAVCWVTNRKDVLGGLLVLASALAFRGRSIRAWVLAWILYLAAALAKAPMTVLPALLLACEVFFPPPGGRRLLRLAPFFALAAPLAVLHHANAMHGLALPGSTPGSWAPTVCGVVMKYLLVLAYPLGGRFPYRPAWAEGWGGRELAAGAVVLALAFASAALAVRAWRGRLGPEGRAAGLGLAWLALCLAPYLHLLGRLTVLLADRYLFVASFGACLAGAPLLARLWGGAARPAVAALLLAYGASDLALARRWRSGPAVVADSLRKDPREGMAWDVLGTDAAERGDWARAFRFHDRALTLLGAEPASHWRMTAAEGGAAWALGQMGRTGEGLKRLDAALARAPRSPELLDARGRLRQRSGDLEGAERDLRERARLESFRPEAWLVLGQVLNNRRRLEASLRALSRAEALQPGRPDVLHALGTVHWNRGDLARGRDFLRRALAAAPGNPGIREDLEALGREEEAEVRLLFAKAARAFEGGRLQEACRGFERVLAMRPGFFEAQLNLGMARLKARDLKGAEEILEKACANRPGDAEARELLSRARSLSPDR